MRRGLDRLDQQGFGNRTAVRHNRGVHLLFGDPAHWPAGDLVAVSEEFDAGIVATGYTEGVFPMPLEGLMGWFSPQQRGVLPLDGLRVTRSLRKMLPRYRTTVDRAFDRVIERCADPERVGGWIDADIIAAYRELHRAGLAHSVEAWTAEGELAGGLYGINIGGLFAGESMFHDDRIGRDASKVALVRLVRLLGPGSGRLLDVQWRTPHLASLGVVEVARPDYLARLADAIELEPPAWTDPA